MKKFAWSFSTLDMFEKCRKKFYHLKVIKDRKEPDNQWQQDGKFVHDALFQYAVNGKPLPLTIRHMQEQVDKMLALPGERHGELRLCLNDSFKPRDFFAKDAWVRAVIDLVIVRGDHAVIIDWKTGKQKPGFAQLRLSAAVLSRYMPEIEKFSLIYAWLKDGEFTSDKMEKGDIRQVWLDYMPRVQRIDAAIATTDFPATPSPLCAYCPITDCPHWIDRD